MCRERCTCSTTAPCRRSLSPNDINWLLTKHPSIYLRGCLLQAAEWLKDDNETMKQGVLFSKLVNGLNKSDMVGQYARADTAISGLVIVGLAQLY